MIIEHLDRPYRSEKFEIVEKKGLGHPDTICDGISDEISRGLARYYLDHFGRVMHHNVDKVLISAGGSSPAFGGGKVIKPLTVIVGGRATDEVDGVRVPVYDIARECAERYLKATMKHLDGNFIVEPRLGMGASELKSLTARTVANDTSIGVGYAPFSRLESDVFEAERLARSVTGVGEDVKIMGLRTGDDLNMTVSAAILSKYTKSMDEYNSIKSAVTGRVKDSISGHWSKMAVSVNAADTKENIFLTITGTSAEMGDDGETGRGNRANGLITPGRPMTMEAHAGKNPVNHVGKIYNIIATRAAADIAGLGQVEDAYVYLVSRIGAPIDSPQLKAVKICGEADAGKIQYAVDYWLEQIPRFTEEFIKGGVTGQTPRQ